MSLYDNYHGELRKMDQVNDQGQRTGRLMAEGIVNAIIHDMAGRAGLLETWEATTPAVRAQTREAWIEIALAYIQSMSA